VDPAEVAHAATARRAVAGVGRPLGVGLFIAGGGGALGALGIGEMGTAVAAFVLALYGLALASVSEDTLRGGSAASV
jgi:hypothetical protein